MGIAKKLNFGNIFLFLFFVVFPFGQIIRIGILQPIDVIVGIGALYAIIKKYPKPEIFRYFESFLIVAGFSWVFSVFFFGRTEVLYGFLYFIRIVAYFYFFIYVWNFAKNKEKTKLLIDSLLGVSIVSAVFGWIQFFLIPDIKPFFTWGWDEHLYRLVGTFLDPTFLGLILVFGLITTIIRIMVVKERKGFLFILAGFLLISLAFTYSRASYLAFIFGVGYLFLIEKKLKYIIYIALVLAGLIFVVPTTKNHSIEFTRAFSAIARVENYKNTLTIFLKSPVFGVGYDNMCIAYQKFVSYQSFSSHACSGSDSSLLFVLATTGVLGLFSFILMINKIWIGGNSVFKASGVAILIHSVFSNSFFYPWIMGWMLILLSYSLRGKGES